LVVLAILQAASIALSNVESATLAGGVWNNTFDVAGWRGKATLSGLPGMDM